MIYIIDTNREDSLVQRIDIENGTYLMPKRVKGTLKEQTRQIIELVEKEKPTQIIFDKHGFGIAIADMFPKEAHIMRAYFDVDSAGRLSHIEI
jgi:hypothetical protein